MSRIKAARKLAQPADTYEIELRLFTSDPQPHVFRTIRRICSDERDYPVVAKWNYIVSKRLRLTSSIEGAGVEDLERLVSDHFLRKDNEEIQETSEHFILDLARAEVIEVSIPYVSEQVGWAARVFPWENALSIVTRRHRIRSLVVVRHLQTIGRNRAPRRKPTSALVVRSTPGVFASQYDFRSESNLVKFKLGDDLKSFSDLDTPTEAQLAAEIRNKKPALIHLAVLDTHGISTSDPDLLKGAWQSPEDEGNAHEGIILRGENSAYRALNASETAKLMAGNSSSPLLVSFATCYSATRLAPMAVAMGAQAAIGFHESVTNAVAEAFFGAFYENWRKLDWDSLAAFQQALQVMWGQPESGRSGVALWSATSLVQGRAQGTSPAPHGRKTLKPLTPAARILELNEANVREIFTITCEPLGQVNYCSLHNGQNLFETFVIRKNVPGLLPPVEVRIDLTAENETATWRQSLAFDDSPGSDSLSDRVRIPLGARALRRVQESVRSSLLVEVRCGPRILIQQSSDVTLLPIDEWRDTEEDRRWLPSFVLPRDPAVRKIIRGADRYLRALCDDSGAGFDGYQQAGDGPEVVDFQARAIWCSLLYDFNLRYINPPPTYTKTTGGIAQRLRIPSQILDEGRGTCIDLALLFASCLEYVGIYPVIFLISGHAFPGWWRNETAYRNFAGFGYTQVPVGTPVQPVGAPVPRDDFAQWMVTGEDGFRELVIPLRDGDLAALESTLLCRGAGFAHALQAGRDNLADAAIFDALVNVQRAREGERPVTPLPIVGLWGLGNAAEPGNGNGELTD